MPLHKVQADLELIPVSSLAEFFPVNPMMYAAFASSNKISLPCREQARERKQKRSLERKILLEGKISLVEIILWSITWDEKNPERLWVCLLSTTFQVKVRSVIFNLIPQMAFDYHYFRWYYKSFQSTWTSLLSESRPEGSFSMQSNCYGSLRSWDQI